MTDGVDNRAETIPPPAASPPANGASTPAISAAQTPQDRQPPAVEVTALIRDFGTPRSPIRAVDNLDL
ncbi:MAG: hypothetical protein M3R46_05860, partial [Actinomycetota bacterium]|nr:hypothetical protein [Actinomycetota bacterium]